MSDSTLAVIKKKARRLSGATSPDQLSESDLEEYIDVFYEQDFPSHLKIWNLHDKFEFFTVANEDQYAFDTDLFHAVVPPVYIDGYQSFYTNSRDEFFRIYPKLSTEQTGPAGDGTTGPYAITLNALPVLKRQVTISVIDTSGATQTVFDRPQALANNVGDLIDSTDNTTNRGTVNYITGVVSVTWPNTVAATENTLVRFHAYQANRPSAMLFFKDNFILRPVPDRVYRVVVDVWQKPTQLLSATNHSDANTPDVQQWWQYIAIGAAIKVLEDRQDVESIKNIMPSFKDQEAKIVYRTATQQVPERTRTIYTDQLQFPIGNRQFGGQ